MYHLDATVFGNPTSNLSQTPGQQFAGTLKTIGRGQYKPYNPTDTIMVDLDYRFSGTQLSQFRQEWEDVSALNFGADWFTVDLPLMLDHSRQADLTLHPYSKETNVEFITAMEIGWSGGSLWGYNNAAFQASPFGSIAPLKIMGVRPGRFFFNSSNFFQMTFEGYDFADSISIPGNDSKIGMYIVETDEYTELNWEVANNRYRSLAGEIQGAVAYAKANIGGLMTISFKLKTQPFQRYKVHIRETYTANMLGYNYWGVNIPVEVDVTPDLVLPLASSAQGLYG